MAVVTVVMVVIVANLTKREIDALAPPAEGQLLVWDDGLKGFGVRVMKSGVKSYVVQYRNAEGRTRRATLGKVDARMTATQARALATQLLAGAARGEDPLQERQNKRAAEDINALLNRYVSDHIEPKKAATTQREWKRIIDKHLRPALGTLKISEVTSADMAKLHASMHSTPRLANLCLAVASKAFSLAETWGYRPPMTNPTRGIERYKEHHRKTKLSVEQLNRLGAAMAEAENVGLPWDIADPSNKHLPKDERLRRFRPNTAALQILRLLLMTGARLSEISSLEWSHVDLKQAMIALPSKKGAERRPHPVGPVALALLAERAKSKKKGRWVFPSSDEAVRPVQKSTIEKAWRALRKRADLVDYRIHDLRHAFGTMASKKGANAFQIRDALRHENITISSLYVASEESPLRQLNAAVEARILAGLSGATDFDGDVDGAEK